MIWSFFTSFGWTEWMIVAGLSFVGYFFLRRHQRNEKEFRDSLATKASVSEGWKAFGAGVQKLLPDAIDADQRRKLAELAQETARLVNEREWIRIAVRVFGMKDSLWPDRIPHLSIWFNTKTGEMKPIEERFRIICGKRESLDGVIGAHVMSQLGVPPYQKVDDRTIILLGVAYIAN